MMRTVTARIAPSMKMMQLKNMSAVSESAAAGVTKEEVLKALNNWGAGLVSISKTYAAKGDYKAVATNVLKTSYAFDISDVLFKPTLASNPTFRGTFDSALSYFVGGNIAEDSGFALIPWDKADFEIAGVLTGANHAILMGNKHLKKTDGSIVKANFTMAFIKDKSGALKINVHHSSLPYTPAK